MQNQISVDYRGLDDGKRSGIHKVYGIDFKLGDGNFVVSINYDGKPLVVSKKHVLIGNEPFGDKEQTILGVQTWIIEELEKIFKEG